MKIFIFFTVLVVFSLLSCNSAKDNIPTVSERTKIKERLIGKWEVLKYNLREAEEMTQGPIPDTLFVMHDNTYRSNSDTGNWFLSFTNDKLTDSATNIIFSKVSEEYTRFKINSFYVKFFRQNNKEFMQQYSLSDHHTIILSKISDQ